MRSLRLVASVVVGSLAVSPALAALPYAGSAAGEKYTVDAVHSSVFFGVRHMGVGNFYGRFNNIAGEFVWSDDDPSACSFSMTVPLESVDTNSEDRDKHLKGPDFFNVDTNPEMKFQSESAKRVSDDLLEVSGKIALGDSAAPVKVRIEKIGAGADMWGGYRCGIEATFTIKRSELGLKSSLEPIGESGIIPLGDEIRVIVAIEGVRQ